MATANEKLNDIMISNSHLVEEYKNHLISTMLIFLKRLEKEVIKIIETDFDEEKFLVKDKNAILKKIKTLQETELNKLKDRIYGDVEKYLGVQADVYKEQLDKVFKDVGEFISVKNIDKATLKKSFNKEKIVFDNGLSYTLASLWMVFFNSVRTRTMQNVEGAFAIGKSKKDLKEDLNTTFKTNERSLEASIAVLVQQAYNIAIRDVNKGNGFVSGYQWISTIDTRTSDICMDLSDRYWIFDYPEKSTLPYEMYPPIHYRCRSMTSPVTKSYEELGISASDLTENQKELLDGSVPRNQSYAEWFNKQPSSVQKEVLGKVRYDAYVNGTSVDKFFSNGRRLTLNQLKTKGIQIADEYLRYVK